MAHSAGQAGVCAERAGTWTRSETPSIGALTMGADLLTFTADASAGLSGPEWLAERRRRGVGAFRDSVTAFRGRRSLEVQRHRQSRPRLVRAFDLLSHDRPRRKATSIALARRVASVIGEWSALVVTVDGALRGRVGARRPADDRDEVLHVHGVFRREHPEPVVVVRDAFDDLHSAFVADRFTCKSLPRRRSGNPVVVVHMVTPGEAGQRLPACFPHLYVHLNTSAEASVVEVMVGSSGVYEDAADYATAEGGSATEQLRGLVVPLTELEVADDARLSFASLQVLPAGWQQLGVQSGRRRGATASLRSFCASLGGSSGRVRADASLVGQGGEATLVAGYLGTGEQLHDLRTIQDHVAPRTSSQLLCMGAVTDHARSAYVGLTKVRNGAHGADAFQTNRNLVLSDGAHADSVPTLDIQENDVRCSHASTVGPIDEDQRYYLESRGIDPSVAERLIVLGFFNDLASKVPITSVGNWFVDTVSDRIREHVGRDVSEDESLSVGGSGQSRG